MKYKKKPVEVEVVQWDGDRKAMLDFCGELVRMDPDESMIAFGDDVLLIKTLEGTMKAELGDYIVRGVNGEYYPVKPDIFHQTYEPA